MAYLWHHNDNGILADEMVSLRACLTINYSGVG